MAGRGQKRKRGEVKTAVTAAKIKKGESGEDATDHRDAQENGDSVAKKGPSMSMPAVKGTAKVPKKNVEKEAKMETESDDGNKDPTGEENIVTVKSKSVGKGTAKGRKIKVNTEVKENETESSKDNKDQTGEQSIVTEKSKPEGKGTARGRKTKVNTEVQENEDKAESSEDNKVPTGEESNLTEKSKPEGKGTAKGRKTKVGTEVKENEKETESSKDNKDTTGEENIATVKSKPGGKGTAKGRKTKVDTEVKVNEKVTESSEDNKDQTDEEDIENGKSKPVVKGTGKGRKKKAEIEVKGNESEHGSSECEDVKVNVKKATKSKPEAKGTAKGRKKEKQVRGNESDTLPDIAGDEDAKQSPNYWLFKSEPETRMEKGVDVKFGIEDLIKEPNQTACWDGVRNYEARNLMRDEMRVGDKGFFYHSNCKPPGIVGVVEVVKAGYPDHTQFDKKDPHYDAVAKKDEPRWFMVDVKFGRKLNRQITLQELKELHLEQKAKGGPLAKMALLTRARLSVVPISPGEWDYVLGMEDQETG